MRQPLGDGMLARGHNYPFGEYMLYYSNRTSLLVSILRCSALPAWLVLLLAVALPLIRRPFA